MARIETKQKVDALQEEVQKRDAKLRQLQAAMEAALAERDGISGELQRVLATSDSAAGVKQVCVCVCVCVCVYVCVCVCVCVRSRV